MNIGNSGFEIVILKEGISSKADWRTASVYATVFKIQNIKTKKLLFKLTHGKYISYRKDSPHVRATEKKFLGLDDRYYWVKATSYTKAVWGQIQSSGAVIGVDRTIIHQLDFYPIYIIKPTAPVLIQATPAPAPVPVVEIMAVAPAETIVEPEVTAKPLGIPNTPPIFTGFKDAKNYYIPKEKTWLEKLINWLKNLLNPR